MALSLVVLAMAGGAASADDVTLSVDPEPGRDRVTLGMLELLAAGPPPRSAWDGGAYEQAASILGREDLLQPRRMWSDNCRPAPGDPDPVAAIASLARDHRVVIINESHSKASHRAFIADLAVALAEVGYSVYAGEALVLEPERSSREPPHDAEGYYVREAMFGRLLRTVQSAGYDLVDYDHAATDEGGEAQAPRTPRESVIAREEAQAVNLERIIRAHAGAKVLIHVGGSHGRETPGGWYFPDEPPVESMAMRLKERTGLDPLTISQIDCADDVSEIRLSINPAQAGAHDLFVQHPEDAFAHGRPTWRQARGDIPTAIPPELTPAEGWAVIEARLAAESDDAVPMDRVAIRAGETDVMLMLPPGRYRARAVGLDSGEAVHAALPEEEP